MIFRFNDKEYKGATAIEVVEQMERDDAEFSAAQTGGTIQEFVKWSLKKMSDRLPPRELDTSPRVDDEVQARGYLSLRHDYGIGELVD
jgi:hypothetical protein